MNSIFDENRLATLFSCCVLIGALWGCGSREPQPELAPVKGIVTLDGGPLSGARIAFVPKTPDAHGNGRVSTGVTDDKGAFELLYGPGRKGAIVGEHTVQISKFSGTAEEPGIESLPARYNTDSELTATVSATQPNQVEFSLVTGTKK